jgi:hypothetical protein
VLAHGLASRVKYVRLVRRRINGNLRFAVQLICEGRPHQKPEHILGQGSVGLDLGPSTIAVVSDAQAVMWARTSRIYPGEGLSRFYGNTCYYTFWLMSISRWAAYNLCGRDSW